MGIYSASKIDAVMREQWTEVRNDRHEARRDGPLLDGSAGASSGGPICGAWQMEDRGWSRVKVIMDSGAAESVCPRTMAPQFTIED